jgi:Phospholipid-binding protein
MRFSLHPVVGATLLLCASGVSAGELFILQSTAFADNAMLDQQYAGNDASNPNCTGKNSSPPLIWSNAPPQTQSYALIVHDPEGAKGLGVTHLVAYNIPSSATGFAPDALKEAKGYTGGKKHARDKYLVRPLPSAGHRSTSLHLHVDCHRFTARTASRADP